MRTVSSIAATLVLSALVALVAAAPASAISVSGKQKVVNENAGKYKMKGDLLGKWKITAFRQIHTSPTYKAKGKEKFNGCIDRDRDRSCDGDPSGKLFFKFKYWAVFDDDDTVALGTCAHRIVGGEGSFAGATGFLQMVDTPIGSPPSLKTHYEGVIDLGHGRAAASEVPPAC
jgi:hypothetical protein